MAGRQRMLAAELRDWAHMVALGQEEDPAGLRSRMAEFEHSLVALQRGGRVREGVVDAAPAELQGELAAAASQWNRLKPDLLTIAEASRQEARFVSAYERVENRLPQLRDLADRFVTALVARRQRQWDEILGMLGLMTAATFAVLLTGLFVTRRYIVRPIAGLEAAARRMQAGDFSRRLDASGRDELGALARTFNAMAEQVEQLLAALDLRRKHAETIVASVSSWLLVLRHDLTVLRVNRSFREAFGPDEGAVGQPVTTLLPAPGLREAAIEVLASGKPLRGLQLEMPWQGSTRSLRVTITGTRLAEEEEELLVAVEDVTERVALEDHLRQSQKMQAVGELAGGIAHDFNNLLTAILISSELMGEELPAGSPVGESLDTIRNAALRAAELTRKLLGFSRRQHLELQPVDLGAVVTDFGRMMRRVIREDIHVRVIIEEARLGALADSGAVEQVLMNLLTNARDATPPGGTVLVKARRAVLNEAYCEERGWGRAGEYVAIEVSDTGAGMDEETRQRIFEPFFTTKPVGKGTGLGMAMVYGLVRQHDGYVDVSSALGRGTTVCVFLPALAEEEGSERPVAAAPPPQGGTETILLVEDEEAVRRLAQHVLERCGYTVLAAVNGAAAIETFEAHRGAIALVISDVVMPVMGGPELFRTLRQAGHRVRFLFTSGYMAREVEATAPIPPGVPFLSKPWNVADFLGKVRMVLDASL